MQWVCDAGRHRLLCSSNHCSQGVLKLQTSYELKNYWSACSRQEQQCLACTLRLQSRLIRQMKKADVLRKTDFAAVFTSAATTTGAAAPAAEAGTACRWDRWWASAVRGVWWSFAAPPSAKWPQYHLQ